MLNKFIEMYNQVDLDIFSAIMVLSVLLYTSKFIKKAGREHKYLIILTILMVILLVIEPFCFVVEEFRMPELRVVSYIAEFINLSLCVYIGFFWSLFTYNYIYKSPVKKKLDRVLLSIPIIVINILMFTNHITGYVFTISENNVYARGDMFVTLTVISAMYTLYSMHTLFKGRRRISKKEFYVLLLYNILPIFGILAQTLVKGTTFSYSSIAFSLTLLYVFLENKITKLDHLTKVYSRTYLDAHIDLLESKRQAKLAIAFMDLDEFKQINDSYGHAEGDFALEKFASVLNRSMPEEAVVSRFGGDEFVVILEGKDVDAAEENFAKFKTNLDRINKALVKQKGYEIKYSIGYGKIGEEHTSPKELLRYVDSKMYEEKLRKKVNRKSLA